MTYKLNIRVVILFLLPTILFADYLYGKISQDKVQIRVFVQMNSEEQSNNNLLFQFVNAYNKSQNRIELILDITTAGCSFDATDSLLLRLAGDEPPDITSLRYSVLWDHFLDLTPYLAKYNLSEMDTSLFPRYRHKKCLIYFPLGYSTDLLFYNKKMFDKAGLHYPPHHYGEAYADGETWNVEKLEKIAMLLTLDRNGHNANHPEFDPSNIVQYGFHWAWNNGIGFTQMFGPPQIINQDRSVSIPDYIREGYHWSYDGIWKKHFIPSDQIFVDTMLTEPLASKRTAMVLTGSYYCNSLTDTTLHWDIAAIPSYNGKHNVSWGEGGFGILNTSRSPEEAMEVIMMIANTMDYYSSEGPTIPTLSSLKTEVLNQLKKIFPAMDLQVFLDGLNYLSPINDGDAVEYNMSAWRLFNDYRGYLRQDPFADVDGALDTWLTPKLNDIFRTTSIESTHSNYVPQQYRLSQNYPNPFNSSTKIVFELPQASEVELIVYDVLGKQVRSLDRNFYSAGTYEVNWDGNDEAGNPLSSGIYFIQMKLAKQFFTCKAVLLK